jgi:hypothetical protein
MSAVRLTCESIHPPTTAAEVARGVARLFLAHDMVALFEVPLGNGRRADVMALDAAGRLTIVEIKVARGDLLGDMKWPDYLDYCDRFFWAVPPGFDASPLDGEFFMPDRSGVIVADRYAGVIVREARSTPLAGARRKAETLRFARRAAGRLLGVLDPDIALPEGA